MIRPLHKYFNLYTLSFFWCQKIMKMRGVVTPAMMIDQYVACRLAVILVEIVGCC